MSDRQTFTPPRVRQRRKILRVTQEWLAEQIGCSVALVSMIENGKRQYTQEFLEAAARHLRTTPSRLLAPDDDDGLYAALMEIPAHERARAKAVLEAFTATFEQGPAPVSAPRKTRRRAG
jgi:transcriptional regulator with XRE-family HTH domain